METLVDQCKKSNEGQWLLLGPDEKVGSNCVAGGAGVTRRGIADVFQSCSAAQRAGGSARSDHQVSSRIPRSEDAIAAHCGKNRKYRRTKSKVAFPAHFRAGNGARRSARAQPGTDDYPAR